jgi:hypothetical protein
LSDVRIDFERRAMPGQVSKERVIRTGLERREKSELILKEEFTELILKRERC